MIYKYSWLLLMLLHGVCNQTTDKYTDENRPYKFGFNIQGYQHRQEEKDDRGLIKGEYGFITADGYYRVTVYATDENGDFRILSMKNYYVGFPPEDPTTTPQPPSRQSVNPNNQFSNPSLGSGPGNAFNSQGGKGSVPGRDENIGKQFSKPVPQSGLAACSDCSIPTTTKRPGGIGGQGGNSGQFPKGNGFGGPTGNSGGTGGSQFGSNFGGFDGNRVGNSPGQVPPGAGSPGFQSSSKPNYPNVDQSGPTFSQPSSGQFSPGSGGPTTSFNSGNQQSPNQGFIPTTGSVSNNLGSFNEPSQPPRRKPQIGETKDGLPPGVTLGDIKSLLYRFNYTVGFHGHHEDGFRNGDKEGDYFFDGRDGVERKVEYLANEFGYQPNITFIDLPENDVRRPHEETEKEYGLKGYEFKWFYRR